MIVINDFFIVAIEGKYENGKTASGIILLNDAYTEDWAEEHLKYRRKTGVVMTTPLNFSDTVIDVKIGGMPEPKVFVSGEQLEQLHAGYSKRRINYQPSTFEGYPTVTLADIGALVDVKRGDKIYFDQFVTDQENFLGKHNGKDLYNCRVDQIYCAVRDGKIVPQGQWCVVKPDMESWSDITTKSGLLKKPSPEAHYLLGYVESIRPRPDIQPGDHILYQRHADYETMIEGQKYFVMKEDDVLCRV